MTVVDVYILRKIGLPFAAAVGIALIAMLLDKLIHVLDLVVNKGGPFWLLLRMLADLVPPYLGLALPAALFAGVLVATIQLSSGAELDAIQAAGVGLARLMVPTMALAVVAMVGGTILLGLLQPQAFYSYRSLVYLVTNTVWDATLERGDFFTGFGGSTILVNHISGTNRTLSGIFLFEPQADGGSVTVTAESGTVFRSGAASSYILHLVHGVRIEAMSNHRARVIRFEEIDVPLDPDVAAAFPESRGDNIRELTLSELWRHDGQFKFSPGKWAAELNGRLVRIASFLIMPVLGMTLGIGSSRRRRGAQVVIGALLLVIYNHTLQFGGSLVGSGQLPALVALWLPFLLFGGFSAWSFRMACRWPGEPPLERIALWLGGALSSAVAVARGRARVRSVARRRLT